MLPYYSSFHEKTLKLLLFLQNMNIDFISHTPGIQDNLRVRLFPISYDRKVNQGNTNTLSKALFQIQRST